MKLILPQVSILYHSDGIRNYFHSGSDLHDPTGFLKIRFEKYVELTRILLIFLLKKIEKTFSIKICELSVVLVLYYMII